MNKPLSEDYLDLCDRVGEIDQEAKEYLLKEAPKLRGFSDNACLMSTVFTWGKTPQGWEYWSNISNMLGE